MPWAPAYATTAELKSYLRITDAVDDTEVDLAVAAASRAVDQAANRQFGQVTPVEARIFTARRDKNMGRWVIDVDDIYDDTGLLVDHDTDDSQSFATSIDSLRLLPYNAAEIGFPWSQIAVNSGATSTPNATPGTTRVTALWGWSAVPDTIKQATLLQASRFFMRRNAPFGVAGSPEMGSELRLLDRVDPDVEVALRPYRRVWGAV